ARQQLLVEVEQLDLEVAVGVGSTEQHVLGLPLVIRQSERRVLQHFDVAADEARLTGAALALFAAMHEGDALTERRLQNGLALLDVHFDADGLETHFVHLSVAHPRGLLCALCALFARFYRVRRGDLSRDALSDPYATG